MNAHQVGAVLSADAIRAERIRRAAEAELSRAKDHAGVHLSSFIRAGWRIVEPVYPLKWGWALDCVAEHLEAVTLGQITRVLINEPPGFMKSLMSVFWNAYEWGPKGRPDLRYLTAAYKEELSIRDNVKVRRLVTSEWYRERWPDVRIVGDQNQKRKFETTATGWRQAAAFHSLTGDRGDRLVIDDAISGNQARSDVERKKAEETLLETVPLRINDPEKSAIVLIGQRLHEGDPYGVALAKDLGYVHVCLPMEFEPDRRCYTVIRPSWYKGEPRRGRYDGGNQRWYFEGDEIPEKRLEFIQAARWQSVYPQDRRVTDGELLFPERFPREVVEREKISLGSAGAAGQFQQRPAPREGGLFKRSNFGVIQDAEIPAGTIWVRGWDLAATDSADAAQTCGVKMGKTPDRRFIIKTVVRERLGPAAVRSLIRSTAEVDTRSCRISIPQDPGQAGKAQKMDFLRLLAGFAVRITPETGDKVTRAEPFAAQVEGGNVFIVPGPWADGFLDEVCLFPNGKFKDAVDACSRAFAELVQMSAGMPIRGKVGS